MESPDTLLIEQVKHNCDVSDARFWGAFSICGLLMRYRDLFRSEQGLAPWAEIRREEIAAWIGGKEARWPELEQQTFRGLVIDGREFPPFAVPDINEALRGKGLVYGAGYGMYWKPTFFLAELRSHQETAGQSVSVAGREWVRDLFTAPAMLQEGCIFLRLEPLTVLLWEKFTELGAGRGFALEDAFSLHGIRPGQAVDAALVQKLEAIAERYAAVLLRHEVAESGEDVPAWKEILAAAGDRKAEQYLRALKDLIADTADAGPLAMIINGQDRGSLGFLVGLMEGFRKALYPELREAYQRFQGDENWAPLEAARRKGYARFLAQREQVVTLYRSCRREDFVGNLKSLIG